MKTLEQLFPNPKGRRKADEAIDALPLDTSIRDATWLWELRYFEVTKTSPFRKG